ncbi:nucleotidyltransferase family protein [Legionella taurinensis]|uniref:Nucleotidyltransferase family protein n=1 Tax=Legionella taurinensis TaxID=70611 RepID=A0A3A5L7I4_9GAMM|nr:nucleotidyltransferase family protein [Legionella taurinensis]MDX1836381.1 nucleotidyltransferase family protein [Legionella taurinensis]PUT41870.1 nucleotidyltransferase family protein [Legionella taurinensis]PUT44658.1 nucleotidyltransferase family protein [Legionella taurinensis]PUT47978.1 nucleotidyltransferase family protein [Legionella taurinensis]PUT48792.1 nucleotidyltransferase family protein [Legionella taurinensis]
MKTAMILAAGRGERLKPVTLYTPKAMCRVQGIPLIERHVVNLARAGFEKIIINHAYLGGQIRHHLGDGRRFGVTIHYSPEPPGGLETGGGIQNALQLLGDAPFLTVNADIITHYDFTRLALPQDSLLHLVLVPNPAHNRAGDFGLTTEGRLTNDRVYTYPGIACYHPQALKHCLPGRYSVVPLMRALVRNQQATGELFEGVWLDIGSTDRLNQANTLACD